MRAGVSPRVAAESVAARYNFAGAEIDTITARVEHVLATTPKPTPYPGGLTIADLAARFDAAIRAGSPLKIWTQHEHVQVEFADVLGPTGDPLTIECEVEHEPDVDDPGVLLGVRILNAAICGADGVWYGDLPAWPYAFALAVLAHCDTEHRCSCDECGETFFAVKSSRWCGCTPRGDL